MPLTMYHPAMFMFEMERVTLDSGGAESERDDKMCRFLQVSKPGEHLSLASISGQPRATPPTPQPLTRQVWAGGDTTAQAHKWLQQCSSHCNEEYLVREPVLT